MNPPTNSKVFKPLVAGSLALFLSAGIASATPVCNTNGTSAICYGFGDNNPTQFNDSGKLTWTDDSGKSKPQYTDSTSSTATTIKELRLDFGSQTGTASSISGNWDTTKQLYTINANGGKYPASQTFVINGGTKGIKMGDDGKGILSVDFRQRDAKREVILNFDKVTSGNTSFEGDMNFYLGADGWNDNPPHNPETLKSRVVANFNKDMKGNIRFLQEWGNSRENIFTFKNGASLKGDLISYSGNNTFLFDGGNLEGNLESLKYGTNIINMRGNTATIENGRIHAGPWSAGRNIININAEIGAIKSTVNAQQGQNIITMSGQTATIQGAITANGGGSGKNTINLNAASNTITGKVEATRGTNIINTSGNGSFELKEDMVTGNKNGSGGTNKLNLNAKSNTIRSDIITNSNGQNNITAENLTIQKATSNETLILAQGGWGSKNTITAKNLNINIDGIISTGNRNGRNTNTITAQNLTLKVDAIIAQTPTDNNKTEAKGNFFNTRSGKLEIQYLAASNANNTFKATGGLTHLTITDELVATNKGSNIFSASHGALMFNTASNATITAENGGQNTILLKQGGKFLTTTDKLSFQNLVFDDVKFDKNQAGQNTLAQNNAIVDLATGGKDLLELTSRKDFRLLTLGEDPVANGNNADAGSANGLIGNNGLFRVYVNNSGYSTSNKLGGKNASNASDTYGYAYSDRVVVHKVSNADNSAPATPVTQYVQVLFDKNADLSKIAYSGGDVTSAGDIAVFTAKNDSTGKSSVDLKTVDSVLGFEQVQTSITSKTTDANGKNPTNSSSNPADTYTTYFLTSAKNQGVSLANQKTTSSALGNNYMLYLANLNSLNKRMGELRENTHTHGTWARVFNGMQSTNFSNALDTRSIYTTLQGGYDYSFGFKGASNTLGFALSYANSISKSGVTKELDGSEKGIKHAFSNAIELAIYNAYVQDGASKATGWKNGLYTDSIVKFSYISSDLNLFGEASNKTTNLAFTLSQEIGYRFLLGNDKEFYIDPQGEITLGYLNQSNLKQTLAGHNLLGVQDAIFTLRSRIGSSYGYKFDKFTQNKGFNSSLYLGTYFVSDFIIGGDVHLVSTSNQSLSLSPLASTARFVLNLGTNFKIKDNTRIYFDFERSFGGKITTDYQLNLGVRYSFGTSAYTPYTEANTQEIKDSNTLKEVEPTKGYYIEVLEKEANKLSSKEKKVLEKLKNNLRVQTKIQGNKTMKAYLAGPFKDESKAKVAKSELEGVLKELKSKGNILEVE